MFGNCCCWKIIRDLCCKAQAICILNSLNRINYKGRIFAVNRHMAWISPNCFVILANYCGFLYNLCFMYWLLYIHTLIWAWAPQYSAIPKLIEVCLLYKLDSGIARKFSQGVRNSNYVQSSTYLYCFWTTANIVYRLLVFAQVFSEAPPTTRRNQKARLQNSNRLKLSTNVLEVMR